MHVRRWSRLLVSFAVLAAGAPPAARAATVFTYQGQLQQNGTPVTGTCDLQFELFDAASDGNPIGLLNILLGTQLSDGLFTVPLDFGPAFDGSSRWLQIESRCPAGNGDFVTLAPRQLLTSVPYALGLQYPFTGAAVTADPALSLTNSGPGPTARFRKVTLNGGPAGTAVEGESTDNGGTGVRGTANIGETARAIAGQSLTGFAGYFDGRVQVISPRSDEPDAFVVSVEFEKQARIDASGKGFFNGGTQMGGADVAEFVLTSDQPRPGDVVEIDSENPGRFRLSALANSTAVAGVISTQPGVSLNAASGAAAPVEGPQLALVGRVPVKVTAENGPIRPGDLLVTSTVPGHAMRGPHNPAAGTVIGKALSAHAKGEGVVEMLVMLR